MKMSLEFSSVINHHEHECVKIFIQDYQLDGPIMTLEVNDGSNYRTSLNLSEMKEALSIFEKYIAARKSIVGEASA